MSSTKNLEKVIQRVNTAKLNALDRSFINKIAEDTANQIKTRTRLGKGVASNNSRYYNLPPLLDKTVDRREDLEEIGGLSEYTTPSKSNLTETGEMLDSIKGKVVGKSRVEIKLTGEHSKAGVSNSKLAGFHEKRYKRRLPRPFFHSASSEINEIKRKVRDRINQFLRKI